MTLRPVPAAARQHIRPGRAASLAAWPAATPARCCAPSAAAATRPGLPGMRARPAGRVIIDAAAILAEPPQQSLRPGPGVRPGASQRRRGDLAVPHRTRHPDRQHRRRLGTRQDGHRGLDGGHPHRTAVVVTVLPWTRRFIVRRAWCVLSRHRIQRVCFETRMHTRSGRLPLVLRIAPTEVGERALIWCRAGICAEDFEAHAGEIAAACLARQARIEGQPAVGAARPARHRAPRHPRPAPRHPLRPARRPSAPADTRRVTPPLGTQPAARRSQASNSI